MSSADAIIELDDKRQLMQRINDLINHDHEKVLSFLDKKDHPSTFENYDDFQVLVLRRLRLAEGKMVLWSEVFLFLTEKIYYFDREQDAFVPIDGESNLCKMLVEFYEQNKKIIIGYSGEVEALERDLFERDIPRHFMDLWFNLKKDLTRFENFYYRNLIIFQEFKTFIHNRSSEVGDCFENIYENIKFQDANVLALKSRLDSVHHYYDSIKQDRLNQTIFTLTIISAIFLPMNLVVGFFGINTEGLFFKDDPQGTMNVIYLLIGITLVVLIGLKVIRIIDHYILRYLLGRFSFYKNISSRFEEIEKRLSGR